MDLEPVEVRTLLDIKRVIAPFLKAQNSGDVSFKVDLKYVDDKGKKREESVDCNTIAVSMKQMLIDGFKNVKIRTKALVEAKKLCEEDIYAPDLGKIDIDKIRIAGLDDMIKERLGGYRKGMRVRWKVKEGTFEYDPFECKLYEITDDSDD